MSVFRNAAFALVAVGLLVVGFLVLIPTNVAATEVRLQTGDVAPLVIRTDNPGVVSDAYSFDVTVPVHIAAGEHIPLNYARVLVGASTAGFVGGALSPTLCDQNTSGTGTAGVGVSIVSIAGASPATATFFGYGYTMAVNGNGYGYDFTGKTQVDWVATHGSASGVGYGYGYTSGVTVTVTLRVTGCIGPVGSAAPFAFTGANPLVDFRVQVFVGGSAGQTHPSAPVHALLFDPNFVATTTPNAAGGTTPQPGPSSASGGVESFSWVVMDTDGDGTPFEPVAAGTIFPVIAFPLNLGPHQAISFQLTATQQLPAGTQILFSFQDDGTTQSLTAPPFNINPTLLAVQTGNILPSNFFQIHLARPGLPIASTSGVVSLDIIFGVPQAYFAATGTSQALFSLKGFKDDGTLESPQPARTAGPTLVGTSNQYTFRITAFSAFAGHGAVAGGGGGGGGGASTTTGATTGTPSTTSTTVTQNPTDGTSAPLPTDTGTGTGTAPPSTGPGTSSAPTTPDTEGGGFPGWLIAVLVIFGAAAIVAVAIVFGRRLRNK